MGFKRKEVHGNYASPSKGFITIRCKEDDEYDGFHAQSRELTRGKHEGDTVWEFAFPSYEGELKDVQIRRSNEGSDYGDQVIFIVTDKSLPKNDRYREISIQVDIGSAYASKFVQVLENLDLRKPVEFEPFYLEKRDVPGKFNSGWNIKQVGKIVKKTIENDELPEIVITKKKGGKKDYNADERIEFVEKKLKVFMKKAKLGDFKPKDEPVEDDDDDEGDEEEEEAPKKSSKSKPAPAAKSKPKKNFDEDDEEEDDDDEEEEAPKKKSKKPAPKSKAKKDEEEDDDDDDDDDEF